jgi:flavin-binding protein dodecin
MNESIYKVVELIGTSETSWGEAAQNAVQTAGNSLRDLRIAEISKLDMRVENGKVKTYRARVNQSFKIESQAQFSDLSKLMGIYA